MMTRPFIILLAGALLSAATANADKRSKRDRDRDDEEETTRSAKRSIGGEDRKRAARSIDDDEVDQEEDVERPKKKAKKKIGQAPGDTDGPEATAILPIKLDNLIETAIRHSPHLARMKLNRIAAKGDAGAARVEQAWVMRAKGSYERYGVGGDVDVVVAEVVDQEKYDGKLGLGRKLPTGGNISLDVGFNRTDTEYAVSKEALAAATTPAEGQDPNAKTLAEYQTRHTTNAMLSFTQPLLRGLGSDVALSKERKADFLYSEATLNAQVEAEKSILDLVISYWELAYQAHEVNARLDSLELAERHEKLTREEIRAGASPNSALNAVLYEIAAREEAKIKAQTELEKKSLDVRRKAGLDLEDRSVIIRPGEAFVAGTQEFEVDDVLERSRKSNRKLVMLSMRKRAAQVDVDVANDAAKPQLDFSVAGGVVGTGETPDQAFSNATSAAGFQVMASLTFQWELSGHVKDAQKAAVARRQQVEVERIDLQRQIDNEVVAAVAAVKAARVRIGLTEKAAALAEENVKAERAQFQAQRSSNFEVMKRQSELAEAEMRRGRAIADYHIAVAQLRYHSGTLLDDYRVNVRPIVEK
jgi:outer membrane protein TolC